MRSTQRQSWPQVGLLCLALTGNALAWGPHPDITQAALDAVGPEAALVKLLGEEARLLRDYCQMPDWRRSLHREAKVWFNTDDYLLMPALPEHVDHLCPAVRRAYEPCFRRTLQALRTENSQNASRWVGTLVHFTEDSGAPPHAGEIKGDLHGRLENWLDGKLIHIADYKPRLLGATDDEALAGYLKRMDGLIAFSKQRCERAKPLVVSGDRAAAEPIILESALESARVVADLLLTLGELAKINPPENNATLRGTISAGAVDDLTLVSAKVMLVGTPHATLADAEGKYGFRHLPPGHYTMAVLCPGSVPAEAGVSLATHQEVVKPVALVPDAPAGNMVRNASLQTHWLTPDRSDCWYPAKTATNEKALEGEKLPLQAGASYRLRVDWQPGATGRVLLRCYAAPPATKPVAEYVVEAGGGVLDLVPTPEMRQVQVLLCSKTAPGAVCRHIAFWRLAGTGTK